LLGAIFAIVWIFFPALLDPGCVVLLAHSRADVKISLPPYCVEKADVPGDAATNYFEREHKSRGLVHHSWILCDVPREPATRTISATLGPQWLPSYVPSAFQYRRAVVIFPFAQPLPAGTSRIIGEVCLVSWRRYISQIAGQCNHKFALWK
jgi:hypothetical protein